jgi:phosphoribosylaminoimidazolecarboxamide formyltransferase / IMP cyclohydrolase
MPNALLSVSDKSGVVEFARELCALGWNVLSTGGTARALYEAGIAVTEVSEITGHPEIMEGRVKTLHPAIHAGLLARRSNDADVAALRALGYAPIDLVAVNLYPFRRAAAANAPLAEAMEQVDIGGPAMLRAAAKNHTDVVVVVDPADYAVVLDALRAGAADERLRRRLAAKVFDHTARYDRAIADYLDRQHEAPAAASNGWLPETIELRLRRVQPLRYGENPDQAAAFYADEQPPPGGLPDLRQIHGKELSFNNLLDVEAAVMAVSAWPSDERPACVIIKHTTPCGCALGHDALEAYRRALASDPVSAFGGIVAFNGVVTSDVAEELAGIFLEIVVAPAFDEPALRILRGKKNLRVITLLTNAAGEELDYKRVRGGFLVQQRLRMRFPENDWRVVTRREPDARELADLRFAWRVAAAVKSNAIVLARDEQTIGIGAGQTSRVDASRLAVAKARAANPGAIAAGAVLASDAFFPFRDGVDAAAQAGASAVIQPGGSVRDKEVIAAADEHSMAMILTGRRLFRH